MPIYEYRCRKCDKVFEKIQKMNEGGALLKCPYCGGQKPDRILSSFSCNRDAETSPPRAPARHSSGCS